MTSAAAERLKAIMQFTELGSGFKIAMRDLEIRGAGNVLGAEQHGHMDKVGYELYAKILKEELTGERQESVDLDIKATALSRNSTSSRAQGAWTATSRSPRSARLPTTSASAVRWRRRTARFRPRRSICSSSPSSRAMRLRSASGRSRVDRKGGALEFSSLSSLGDKGLAAAMEKFAGSVGLDMTSAPVVTFRPQADGGKTMILMTKFLKFARSFA